MEKAEIKWEVDTCVSRRSSSISDKNSWLESERLENHRVKENLEKWKE